MAKNKKPRKAYKPRLAPAIPIVFGLANDKKTDMRLPYHLSLEALRNGCGSDDDAHTIVSALLIGRELSKLYQAEAQQKVMLGIEAITAVKHRGDNGC